LTTHQGTHLFAMLLAFVGLDLLTVTLSSVGHPTILQINGAFTTKLGSVYQEKPFPQQA